MLFDLSFIPSYECNLKCWFCMYECSPDKKEELDIEKARYFLSRVDFSMINEVGFYGGEVSINMDLYQKFIDLIPDHIQKFSITNGSWSTNIFETKRFMNFISFNKLYMKVSSTPEHKKYQNEGVLRKLHEWKIVSVKENDDTKSKLLSMGRLKDQPFSCSLKCLRTKSNEPYRIAMEPDGSFMFQSCDGIYPTIGNWKNTLEELENNIFDLIKKKRLLNESY